MVVAQTAVHRRCFAPARAWRGFWISFGTCSLGRRDPGGAITGRGLGTNWVVRHLDWLGCFQKTTTLANAADSGKQVLRGRGLRRGDYQSCCGGFARRHMEVV